ncbi:Bcalo3 [Botrytis cinerea B05.10]|uniref:Bcalo3 n=2 Tax=Botryotinia fuckeliana TaxID=40559 RepID=A0A384JD93_BOTFB|nr:Bcalo3 [Botrytis cinerea B05.10]ATZ48284.1 Bcalo3 [Botrytis cinerea B05.10]CCD51612.1 similar to pyridine nucleotide-disulphide oxidoreductase AMID-like [Botrytis cinerea T4]
MFNNNEKYRPHILVIGGAYGGFSVVTNVLNLIEGNPQLSSPLSPPPLEDFKIRTTPRITILDERDGIYHTMGSPLAHSKSEFASEAWRRFDDIPILHRNNVRTIQGKASSIDMASRVATYQENSTSPLMEIPYDYLVVATGASRNWPVVPKSTTREEYLQDIHGHIESLRRSKRVVIVGGGAVGVEFAAEIKANFPNTEVYLVQSRPHLLHAEPLPNEFKQRAADILTKMGIQLVLGCRVTKILDDSTPGFKSMVTLSNGMRLGADHVIQTNSLHVARTEFLPKKVLDSHGCINVRPTLQFPSDLVNADFHYAAGDVVSWSGIKRVGNAFIMGQHVATNIVRQICSSRVKENPTALAVCPQIKPMMALSIGDTALVYPKDENDSWGEEQQNLVVGRGLGIDLCSAYLRL